MKYLLARLREKDGRLCRVLSHKENLYTVPDLSQSESDNPDYLLEPDYRLEEKAWYKLEKFTSLGFDNPFIGSKLNTADYNQLEVADYPKVAYFSCKQDGYWLFQKITPGQTLRKRWFSISEAPSLSDEPLIFLNNHLDAVYHIADNILYFRKLGRIREIFNNIESLYREATKKEVEDTLKKLSLFVDFPESCSVEDVKPANRKRIVRVKEKMSSLNEKGMQELAKYISDYCSDIPLKNGKLQISSESFGVQLKNILYGIDERYYTTRESGEKRLANSIKIINKS